MIGRTNSGSGGAGGTLTVTAPAGAYVILSEDGSTPKTYKIANSAGIAIFKGLKSGVWYVGIYDGEKFASKTVTITTDYSVLISFNTIPEFTYTGDFEIVNDSDEPITTSQDNWKIRFLTSGLLTFTALNGADDGVDVFLVGAGGGGGHGYTYRGAGGGGGGYTTTAKAISVTIGVSYEIIIGAGGEPATAYNAPASDGGTTSAFGVSANGGSGAPALVETGGTYVGGAGGNGGSAGGSGSGSSNTESGENGGTDGSSCEDATGQGTTTGEFGDSNGKKYAGGGGGGGGQQNDSSTAAGGTGGSIGGGDGGKGGSSGTSGKSGTENTGGGGGGGGSKTSGGSGGSGIVIIRNHREVA